MKNKLSDLNDHLFAQLERLGDEDLEPEELAQGIDRGKAITSVAQQIIANGKLALDAQIALGDQLIPAIPKMLGMDNDNSNYTRQQIDWLREHRPQTAALELSTAFNALFTTELSGEQIKRACLRNGIRSANSGRFVAGHSSWNDGVKGIRHSAATEFKKGHMPKNHLPVGTELMKGDDYLWVKIAEPNVWKQKHRLIWEAQNGPQPKARRLYSWIVTEQISQMITCNWSPIGNYCK